VSQTVTGCEGPKDTITVTVLDTTGANAGTGQFIEIDTVQLATTAPSSGTGTWSVVSGTGTFTNSSSLTTIVTGLSNGANVFKWTVTNSNGCSSSSTVKVCNTSAPVATQTITYCQRATATALTATASSGGTLNWYTSVNGTAIATAPKPSTANTDTVLYYVSQTIAGCEGPKDTITVIVLDTTGANAGVSQSIKADTAQLAATAPSSGTGVWSVVSGTGTFINSSLPTTIVTGLRNGANVLKWAITNSNGCPSSNTVTINVCITTAPATTQTITYCQGATAKALTATASSGGTLNWYTQSSNTASATAPMPSTASIGTALYYVSQTVSNCESPKDTITVEITTCITGITGQNSIQAVNVYPNPATDNITISVPTPGFDVAIFDAVGSKVIGVSATGSQYNLSTSSFKKGIYLVVVTVGDNSSTTKVVIE